MKLRKWTTLMLCAVCLFVSGCQAQGGVTRSGSDEWSRGVVIGSTEGDPVAVATWEGTTFVAWIAESGHVQLAQLDAALNLERTTDLALTTAYPYRNMVLEAEAADRVHVAWLDSIEGKRTVVHAVLVPGSAEPVLRQEKRLPEEADYIQFVVHPEAQQLEIFWSADERHNSGVYHQALSLAGDEGAPPLQLTETGWQPGVGWSSSGTIQVTWLEEGRGGHFAVWRADFDSEEQSLENPASVTQVRVRRGYRFQGPAVGSAGAETVVAWAIGYRLTVGRGRSLDAPSGGRQIGAGLASYGAGSTITSDVGQYTLTSAQPGAEAPIYPLTTGRVVEIWQAPQMRTVGDRTWAVFSAWVAWRGDLRMQIVVVPFDENGPGEPAVVTRTRPLSVWPDLAVATDGTQRAAWVEPLGEDMYEVVVASTADEALEALGGFRLADVFNDAATFAFENLALLGYAPYVIGWAVLPVGLLLIGTFVRPGRVRGWEASLWLGAAIVLQFASKRFLAPQLVSFGPDPVEAALCVAPIVLGIALMWIYWRRAREPMLLGAYGLFIGVDALFTVFIMVPRLLWRS